MAQIPKVLKNFSAWIDGFGFAGKVVEAKLPDLKIKTEDHRGGGMDVPRPIDMGMEKLECEITLKEFSKEAIKTFGLFNNADTGVTLRGGLDDDSGEVVPVEVRMRGLATEVNPDAWKPGEAPSLKVKFGLTYFEYKHQEEVLVKIDVLNLIREIGGEDQLAKMREAIGV